jgi:hypothetical protein
MSKTKIGKFVAVNAKTKPHLVRRYFPAFAQHLRGKIKTNGKARKG